MMRTWCVMLLVASLGSARAATLYSTGAEDNNQLRAIDPTDASTLSSQTITIGGKPAGVVTALVNDPQTGTLFGAVREIVCADASRTTFVPACSDLTVQGACDASFERRGARAAPCRWTGAACEYCSVGATEGACVDTCFTTPACTNDPGRVYAGFDDCSQFAADQTGCENAFTTGICGVTSCYWTGSSCSVCNVATERDGMCTNACGAFGPSEKVHLATIDPSTAVATSRGELGDRFGGLAFTCDGRLFGVTADGACGDVDTLYAIDPADASKDKLATYGNDNDGEMLAFNPLDGRLYYASGDDGDPGVLYQSIDPDTLATTPLTFDTLLDDEEVQALCWSEADQAFLWKQNHGTGPLYRTSPDGQTVATIGTTDHQLKGLAFAEPIAACIVCGDGLLAITEGCDDGNTTDRDCCAAACTVEDAGFAGIGCETGNLLDPAVCGEGGVEAKTAKLVAKRGAKVQSLAAKAEEAAGASDTKKVAKRLRAAGKQVQKLQKVVAKRRAKIGESCATELEAILGRLAAVVSPIPTT